ncbi:AAA family ATPase [Floridanema aerugineum]|uniref:ATP/GTP-binding protein n=1 Tax=Floridaenema aerugineum BLCC-F46 TaxID=3153654 RepID=A0ABV4X8W6_9CYAN
MLKSLKIENFRCFPSFELNPLGRVNLLVGTNNSGKTSILEAIQLLCSRASLETWRDIIINRGEYIVLTEVTEERVWQRGGLQRELDVRHLFYGHEIDIGSTLSISGKNDSDDENLVISIESKPNSELNLSEDLQEIVLHIKWLGKEKDSFPLPLSSNLGIPVDYARRFRRDPKNHLVKTQFVTSSSLTTEKMIELFDQVVLQPEEALITQALNTIEPSIERIASFSAEKYRILGSRSGFVVRLTNSNQRIPIGSMGDGIWRILGLTLALVNARNGVLLVDEIDTGLHFSAMSDMWKLIWKTAKDLNVQVFATTHSSDCWKSLDAIANSENPSEDGITIQRIERDKSSSIVFNERQIVIAAERGIEVR